MPKIPVYERAVEQQPGQPAMLRADASPEAFGAGLARGLSAVGEGMNELAKKQYELDVAKKVNDAESLYADAVRKIFYAPGGDVQPISGSDFTVSVPGGVANLHGDAAVNAAPAAAAAIKQARQEIYSTLDGDAATLFYHRTQRDETQHLDTIGRFASNGVVEARQIARDASNAAVADEMLRDPFNDAASADGLKKFVANARIEAIDKGATPQESEAYAVEATQRWHRTRAAAFADAGHYSAALSYLERPEVKASLGEEADALRNKWKDHADEETANGIVGGIVADATKRDATGAAVGFDAAKALGELEKALDKAGASPMVRAKAHYFLDATVREDDDRRKYEERADYDHLDELCRKRGLGAAMSDPAWGRASLIVRRQLVDLMTPRREGAEKPSYDVNDVAAVMKMMAEPDGKVVPRDLVPYYGRVPNEMWKTAEELINRANPKERGGSADQAYERVHSLARNWLIKANQYTPINPTPDDKARLAHLVEHTFQKSAVGVEDLTDDKLQKTFEEAYAIYAVANTFWGGREYKLGINLTDADRLRSRRVGEQEARDSGLMPVHGDSSQNIPYEQYAAIKAEAKREGKPISQLWPGSGAPTAPTAPTAQRAAAPPEQQLSPYADVFHGVPVTADDIRRDLPAVAEQIGRKWDAHGTGVPMRPEWLVNAYAMGLRNGAYAELPAIKRARK